MHGGPSAVQHDDKGVVLLSQICKNEMDTLTSQGDPGVGSLKRASRGDGKGKRAANDKRV